MGAPLKNRVFVRFSHVIANFNPPSYEASDNSRKRHFLKLSILLWSFKAVVSALHLHDGLPPIGKEAMERNKICLIFDQAIPCLESFFALVGRSIRRSL